MSRIIEENKNGKAVVLHEECSISDIGHADITMLIGVTKPYGAELFCMSSDSESAAFYIPMQSMKTLIPFLSAHLETLELKEVRKKRDDERLQKIWKKARFSSTSRYDTEIENVLSLSDEDFTTWHEQESQEAKVVPIEQE